MKFGKTNKQKHLAMAHKWVSLAKGVKRYAWFPLKLDSGEWLWLEHYWVYAKGIEFLHYDINYFYPKFSHITRHDKPIKDHNPHYSVAAVEAILEVEYDYP